MNAPTPSKGRGALSNREHRYAATRSERVADGWDGAGEASRATEVSPDRSRTIIATNRSPDVPFDRSINPYRGCEHGCVYCFARPTHAYLDLSPGLDFETRLRYKPDAPALLERALAKPDYRCRTLAIGTNTDPYQPVEREHRIMRGILEVLLRHQHPVSITTKSALILRDLDLLAALAARDLCSVGISVTTLDDALKRRLEPRTASPAARLRTIRALTQAGVPASAMAAPVIPAINDHELEAIVAAAAEAGAQGAGYILLRLPLEVAGLFEEWLEAHYPQRAAHVMSLVRQCRGGRDYDPRWGRRMTGEGPFAELLRRRFEVACRRYGLDASAGRPLDASRFRPPGGEQLALL